MERFYGGFLVPSGCIFLHQYRIHMDIGNSKNYLGIRVITLRTRTKQYISTLPHATEPPAMYKLIGSLGISDLGDPNLMKEARRFRKDDEET